MIRLGQMVGSVCEWIYYSPDCCVKHDRCGREHGYSPCFGAITTSSNFSLIVLMWIKMVACECDLGHHLIDHQFAENMLEALQHMDHIDAEESHGSQV
jgi:hypothetical protein